jgi:hypothetical protein
MRLLTFGVDMFGASWTVSRFPESTARFLLAAGLIVTAIAALVAVDLGQGHPASAVQTAAIFAVLLTVDLMVRDKISVSYQPPVYR